MTSTQREAIDIMKRMDTVTVIPALVAQALGMNPDVLRKHARDGEYKISAYEVTGNTVRFFRKDFLQKIGEMDPDPEARTDSDRLEEICTRLMSVDAKESTINMSILLKSDDIAGKLDELIGIEKDIQQGIKLICWFMKKWIEENKPAGAATPTD